MHRARAVLVGVIGLGACNGAGPAIDTTRPDSDAPGPDSGGGAASHSGPFSESCTATGPVGRFTRMLTSNNAAELEGAVLGSDGVIHDPLRRPVTVAVTSIGTAGSLIFGPAFITHDGDDDFLASVFVTVTNTGADTRCSISASGIRWLDERRTVIATDDVAYLDGSVGDLGGIYSDTCLGPGDVGYFISAFPTTSFAGNLFSAVGSVELAVDPGRAGFPVHAALVPTAYLRCGQTRLFEVALESRGPEPVGIWNDLMGRYILADEQGPLEWGFLGPRGGLGVYGPGKTMLVGAQTFYQGIATRLQVYASFDSPLTFARRTGRPRIERLPRGQESPRFRLAP